MREPEFIIRDLLKAYINKEDWQQVKGIGFKVFISVENIPVGYETVVNEPYPYVPLDELPIPDRTLLPKGIDYFNPIILRLPYTTMQTSRGCPGQCKFCNVPDFYGHQFRCRSAENVIKEIQQCVEQGYKEIWFRDETFTAFPTRNKVICEWLIKNKVDLTWIANGRVDMITKEMMQLMKDAGCHMLKFGVETGTQQLLDNVHKGTTLEQARKVFKWAHEIGIDTHAHTMLGLPGENVCTLKQTINFIMEINPTTATFGICTPYPGTPLFKEVQEKAPEIMDGSGIDLKKLHTSGYYNQYFTKLSPEELEKYVRLAYRKFYFRPSYVLKWLMKINNLDQLKRIMLAGSNVFSFGMAKGEKDE